MTTIDPALASGAVRVTIEAAGPEAARRLAVAMQQMWETCEPFEPAPMPGQPHHQVRLYAMPPAQK
jgi:hypothetical protein